jgi:hypothetical protein
MKSLLTRANISNFMIIRNYKELLSLFFSCQFVQITKPEYHFFASHRPVIY